MKKTAGFIEPWVLKAVQLKKSKIYELFVAAEIKRMNIL